MKKNLLYYYLFLLATMYLFACDYKPQVSASLVPLPNNSAQEKQEKINFLTDIIKKNPENSSFYFRRAKLHWELKKENLALLDLREAIRFDSSKAQYFFLEAQIFDFQGKYPEALKAAERAEKHDFQEAELTYLLGKLYYLNQKNKKSISYLQKASALYPEMPEVYHYQGLNYVVLRDSLAADSLLRKSISLKTCYPASYKALVQMYNNFGKSRRAMHYAQQAITNCKGNGELHYLYGETFNRMLWRGSAVEQFALAFRYDSTIWQASEQLYRHNFENKNYPQAAFFLKKTLKVNPDFPNGFGALGYLQEVFLKNNQEALEAYKNAVKKEKDNIAAKEGIERIEKRLAWEAYTKTDAFKEEMRLKRLRELEELKNNEQTATPTEQK